MKSLHKLHILLVLPLLLLFSCEVPPIDNKLSGLERVKDNLLLHYTFDNKDASNSAKNDLHGIIHNNLLFKEGSTGYSAYFTGSEDDTDTSGWVELPIIDFENMKEFTISIWVNEYDLYRPDGTGYIVWGDGDGSWLGIWNHWGRPRISMAPGIQAGVGVDWTNSEYPPVRSIQLIIDPEYYRNQWINHTIVYNKGLFSYYFNGEKIATKLQLPDISIKKGALGRHWWKGGEKFGTRFIGLMDEVRIYDIALYLQEVEYLVNRYQDIFE